MNHFDYNLLRVLEILLEEQSVTAAASRLHLSQSAVSKQLAKLRETFDDQLFERTAHGLRATPRAMQLAPQLRQVLQQLDQFTRPSSFDPSLSQRVFRIDLVETAYSLTYPFFMPDLLAQAPNITLNSQTWNQESIANLLRCDIDMAICTREWDERSQLHINTIPGELNYIELVRDRPVCLIRKEHPLLQETWDLATFLKYRHLQVTFGGIEHWLLDEVLSLQHLKRDIAVNMTDFYSAMSLCEQSDLILCAPARYTAKMSQHFDLLTLDVPVMVEPGGYVLLWHKHFELDPSHRWLRELIINNVGLDG
ncbi:LysR family transcriptional regulator [Photobacterium chitinilyticum]|uniref:LysR family transcriptional regulator n=1 Tax=Photobacterium chitinilyticum TaxID=2485123 RepID=A0A3S3T0P4_9GAMM|nr:LysR family transcriptional regulator [Photobacterium chitinilyticum]RWX56447.1 LysR family transcriptional regulator [Photobacterium chitinilyticum]